MNITAAPTTNDIAGQSLDALAKDSSIPESVKVKRVAEEFEAYLLRTYLSEARKPMVQSKANPDASGQDIYQSMVTGQIADNISKSGSLGLASLLRGQLERESAAAAAARPVFTPTPQPQAPAPAGTPDKKS